jgi:hypothetical protein
VAGKVKRAIDTIIQQRAGGNQLLVTTTKAKLVLKGINPDVYSATSPDDPAVLAKLTQLAAELGIHLAV